MGLLNVFRVVMMKEFIGVKRYIFNTLSGVITITLLFLAIFLGLKFVQVKNFSNTIEGLIIGFFIWTHAIMSYSSLSWGIIEEARAGTLEQLYMSPYGFIWVSFFYVIANFILSFVVSVPVLILMMLITGKMLHIDLLTLIPLLVLTIAGGFGIGYVTGGIGLVFKKVQSFFQILQFVFIGFISAPVDKFPWMKIFPFSLGTNLIARSMRESIPLWRMNKLDILLLILNALFYMASGIIIFKGFEKMAKERGTLGHY